MCVCRHVSKIVFFAKISRMMRWDIFPSINQFFFFRKSNGDVFELRILLVCCADFCWYRGPDCLVREGFAITVIIDIFQCGGIFLAELCRTEVGYSVKSSTVKPFIIISYKLQYEKKIRLTIPVQSFYPKHIPN